MDLGARNIADVLKSDAFLQHPHAFPILRRKIDDLANKVASLQNDSQPDEVPFR